MAVAWRSGSFQEVALGGSVTVTKPTGTVENDVLVAWLFIDATTAITPGSGFTVRQSTDWSGFRSESYTKLCGGSEPADYTFTAGTNYYAIVMGCWSGCDSSSASAHLVDSTENTGTGTTSTGLSITFTRSDSLLVHLAVSGTGTRTSGPATMTNRLTEITNLYIDDETVGSGASGNRTSVYPSQDWVIHMIGLQGPDAGGGGEVVPPANGFFSMPFRNKPANDNNWIRSGGGIWQRRAA